MKTKQVRGLERANFTTQHGFVLRLKNSLFLSETRHTELDYG